MQFGEYHFTGVLEDEAILPPFKGSTFRGVFGHALKKVTCALKRQECPTCLLRRQCVYPRVFEPSLAALPRGGSLPPHPFVIEPPLDSRTHLSRGEEFDFTLLLFGWANQYLPYFVYAFQEMGKIGIGRYVQGQRAQFCLHKVISATGKIIYSHEENTLDPGETINLSLEEPDTSGQGTGEVTITLVTPLRLKFQNRLQANLPFHVLVRAVLRRISTLYECFGEGEPRLDYKGLIARAQDIEVCKSSLRWFDWQRYSLRQDQAMLMGGLLGEVTYLGKIHEFMPLLRFAARVHLGKATTFGLGKCNLRESPAK